MLDNKVKAFFEGSDITSYRYFGAHVSKNGVDFRVYAPHAKSIALVGTFNDWDGEANAIKDTKAGDVAGAIAAHKISHVIYDKEE